MKTLLRSTSYLLALALALAGLSGCHPGACTKDSECPSDARCVEKVCGGEFTTGMTLVGKKKKVPAEWLNAGKEAFMLYCRPCHGADGRGAGVASTALRPPPRDLSIATYKFAGVVDGLPHDEDLARIITGGLTGTAMLPWDLPKDDLYAVIQYIKTFSPPGEGWKEKDGQLGQRVIPPEDPFTEKDEKAAIERGKAIYHTVATCNSCHPAYATRREIYDMSIAMKAAGLRKDAIVAARPAMFLPEAKKSAAFEAHGVKMSILPPDFLFNRVRSISPKRPNGAAQDLYRIIGAGIPGTAMPAWKGAMADKEIWALVHYVKSLVEMRDTDAAVVLQHKLTADIGEFVPPADEAPTTPPAPTTPAPTTPPAPAPDAAPAH